MIRTRPKGIDLHGALGLTGWRDRPQELLAGDMMHLELRVAQTRHRHGRSPKAERFGAVSSYTTLSLHPSRSSPLRRHAGVRTRSGRTRFRGVALHLRLSGPSRYPYQSLYATPFVVPCPEQGSPRLVRFIAAVSAGMPAAWLDILHPQSKGRKSDKDCALHDDKLRKSFQAVQWGYVEQGLPTTTSGALGRKPDDFQLFGNWKSKPPLTRLGSVCLSARLP
ncbi:uncharacterized protein BDZ83DRAFT_305975 [Colletotrichum acutatum]|uniref:Uncharacterized protein n=1 Tax=Glomerella acutata TaxID=27357 RepID=A0AAD8XGG4_GLOAC|nr:uncharacterized protein BDZ83DRAFT_305975 [Colletotrichum acutatum]KAK1725356.1 hypothetical protein BDZ83DRAFT_305975 [Colletotrichum acutatum]